ncbi:SEL1-like repeat protein [Pseudomonas chlororaphis]|uniref:sel1 repeat family protein n=1 Tax=Pseudomonas chlororaphis TaxID=587753 RepID=UPI000B18ADF5|nr:sel1 repeat family protein [Pseudomonas chlororaphis]AZD32625.1 hypothetical protein C4K23_5920 [Pseudomonas chlororaphis]
MKKNNRVRYFSLKWLVLLAFGISSKVFAAQCPSDDFAGFVKELSTKPDMQQAFIISPVIEQAVVATGAKPRVVQKKLKVLDPQSLAMLSEDYIDKSELSLKVQLPNQVLVRDQKGEVLKIFTFKKNGCWALARVEDWSVERVLDSQDAELKTNPGVRALNRGELYNQLGIETESSSSPQLYASALDSYLAGAEQGSAEAAFAAAAISLSGQAPRLENTKILDLLVFASKTLPEAGLALADFYCDEGNYEETRPCVHPEKSMSALMQSARSGFPAALIQLGAAYETGSVAPIDLPHAMACYQEANKKGHEAGPRAIERLTTQGIVADNSIHCL